MSLSKLKDWICDFLHPHCATPAEGFLKPFYRTICYFESAICKNALQTISTNNRIDKSNPSSPNCSVTDYLNHLFENICSPTCNITLPVKTTQIDDAFLQTTQKHMWCKLDWCHVLNHLEVWWEKLYQSWCSSANCLNPAKMHLNFGTAVTIIEKGEPPCLRFLRRWLGIQAPCPYLVAVFCLTGGIFLIINLVMRKLRHRCPSNAEEVEPGLERRLINSLEVTKNSYENLQQRFEETMRAASESHQDLSDQLQLHQRELEMLKKQNREKDADVQKLQQLTSDLEQKCEEYQNQIDKLLEVDSEKNEKLQKKLMDLQSRLDLAHGLHQEEILKLHETIAQLLTQNKETNSILNKQREEYQQELQKSNCFETKDTTDIIQSENTDNQDSCITKAISKIEAIRKNTQELEKKIEDFRGKKEDRMCLHLNELLIRNMISLDNVETESRLIIRIKRREVLEYVQKCIDDLQKKTIR